MSIRMLSEMNRHGTARRVTVGFGSYLVQYEQLAVWLDPADRLAHLLDADMNQHLATVPLDSVFVEWQDLTPIQSVPHIKATTEWPLVAEPMGK
ncbi:MAG TPA: hypothetical protein VFO52_11940 [Longimicrobiales bacterium]|nr:hypothetical protein [Longimicrobiales bacterium]